MIRIYAKEEKKIFDIMLKKNFIFLNVVKNTDLKKQFTKIQSLYENIIKYLNRGINLCNKHKDKDYFKKVKSVLAAKKDISIIY